MKLEMVQLHFKLDLEGLRDQRMDESTHGFLHSSKWIMFHGLPNIVLGPSKKIEPNTKHEAMIINNIAIASYKYYIVTVET
jgi:hypothetical protein